MSLPLKEEKPLTSGLEEEKVVVDAVNDKKSVSISSHLISDSIFMDYSRIAPLDTTKRLLIVPPFYISLCNKKNRYDSEFVPFNESINLEDYGSLSSVLWKTDTTDTYWNERNLLPAQKHHQRSHISNALNEWLYSSSKLRRIVASDSCEVKPHALILVSKLDYVSKFKVVVCDDDSVTNQIWMSFVNVCRRWIDVGVPSYTSICDYELDNMAVNAIPHTNQSVESGILSELNVELSSIISHSNQFLEPGILPESNFELSSFSGEAVTPPFGNIVWRGKGKESSSSVYANLYRPNTMMQVPKGHGLYSDNEVIVLCPGVYSIVFSGFSLLFTAKNHASLYLNKIVEIQEDIPLYKSIEQRMISHKSHSFRLLGLRAISFKSPGYVDGDDFMFTLESAKIEDTVDFEY